MKKSKKEIEYQLSLLRWLMSQPSLKSAVDRAHKLLVEMNQAVKIEGEEEYTAEFLEFWAVYPKKVGKGDALRKFKQLITSKEKKERVILSVEKHKKTPRWTEDGGKYIPNPATFLHQRRFDDDVETPEEKVEKAKAEIKKCEHGYPLYVQCPMCLKEKENGER